MGPAPIPTSRTAVRRLAVAKQHLAGPLPSRAGPRAIRQLVGDLAYVQWDPVAIVAPSHRLALRARLGAFRPSDVERLLWKDRSLFEYWIPFAALVRTDDYPIFRSLMRRYPDSLTRSWGAQRTAAKRFLATHAALRRRVLAELRDGPRTVDEFADHARTRRRDGEWTPASDVAHLLTHLVFSGDVMVVGRRGAQNLWGLAADFLPPTTPRTELTEAEYERAAAQRSLRALGTATPREIHLYFPRGRYAHLPATLAGLERAGAIHRVRVAELGARDERYVHDADREALAAAETDAGVPRLSLLPPFDNLLGNPDRTRRLFGFDYVREQFLPAAKRRYGTYVLPILRGDRFVGRIDPRLDRERSALVVQAVHAEPDAPKDPGVGEELRDELDRLAAFLGAKEVVYPSRVPAPWRKAFR